MAGELERASAAAGTQREALVAEVTSAHEMATRARDLLARRVLGHWQQQAMIACMHAWRAMVDDEMLEREHCAELEAVQEQAAGKTANA